jgi:hypothetical protein
MQSDGGHHGLLQALEAESGGELHLHRVPNVTYEIRSYKKWKEHIYENIESTLKQSNYFKL